jgi:DNA-binding PadR family transcriptional regulator
MEERMTLDEAREQGPEVWQDEGDVTYELTPKGKQALAEAVDGPEGQQMSTSADLSAHQPKEK